VRRIRSTDASSTAAAVSSVSDLTPPVAASQPRGKVVARNVGYNFLSQIWLVVLGLLITPYLVRHLGVGVYGFLTLLLAISAYSAALDFGFGFALVKYISEFYGRRDDAMVRRLVSTAVTVYLGLGVLAGLTLTLVSPWLIDVLGVDRSLRPLAQDAFYISAAALCVTLILSMATAVPNALQRMNLTARRTIAFGTVGMLGQVVLLALGRGLLSLLVLQVVVGVAAVMSFLLVSKRLLPFISLRPTLDISTFKLLGRFSALKFVNQVAATTVMQIDKFLVGAMVSLSAVGYFVVPLQVAQRLPALVGNVAVAFLPAASAFHGQSDRVRLNELYLRATKLVALLVLPLSSMLVIFAHPILTFWIGPTFAEKSSLPLQLLAIGYGLNTFSTIPAITSDSMGRPGVTASFSVASTVLNVGVSLLLIPRFGIEGAALAIVVNSVLLVPYFIFYVHRHVIGLAVFPMIRRSLALPVLATVLSWPAMLLLRTEVNGLLSLGLVLIASFGVYILLSVVVGAYDVKERHLLRTYFRRDPTVPEGSRPTTEAG
jgi:O-antigen/teichoic acid export membrane protein